jgi:DNA-directed RNA polymerase specialized sigma24 family protein
MQYYEGLTIDEIRQITELKYQSIKNLTHRAMLALRAHYKFKEK